MFGNFLEETATGTGATLALAGVTTGNIAFQEKFADGDLVAYVVEDSGGTIKVGGIGTYVSSSDDITRADTWSWNGSTYDDNPSTNITLSGGTHTVRCDVTQKNLFPATTTEYAFAGSPDILNMPHSISQSGSNAPDTPTVSVLVGYRAALFCPVVITSLTIRVTTLDASANDTRVGIWTVGLDGFPDVLLADSGDLDTATTGNKTATLGSPITLSAGWYWWGTFTDSSAVRAECRDHDSGGLWPSSARRMSFSGGLGTFISMSHSAGALTDNPTVTSAINFVNAIDFGWS